MDLGHRANTEWDRKLAIVRSAKRIAAPGTWSKSIEHDFVEARRRRPPEFEEGPVGKDNCLSMRMGVGATIVLPECETLSSSLPPRYCPRGAF